MQKILIVEDNPEMRKVLTQIFEQIICFRKHYQKQAIPVSRRFPELRQSCF